MSDFYWLDDYVFEAERKILQARGYESRLVVVKNDDLETALISHSLLI